MAVFAERGTAPSTIAHWVYADGGGGFLIADEEALDQLYELALHYGPWMDLTTRPIHTIDEALPQIAAFMSS